MIRGQSCKASTIVNYDSRVVIMGYFQVRYDSRVVIYDCRGFIRFATENNFKTKTNDTKGSKDKQVSGCDSVVMSGRFQYQRPTV